MDKERGALLSRDPRSHLEVGHGHDQLHVRVAAPLVRLGVKHRGYQVAGRLRGPVREVLRALPDE